MYRSALRVSLVQLSLVRLRVDFHLRLQPRPSVLSSRSPLLLPLLLVSSPNRMESMSTNSVLSSNSQHINTPHVGEASISVHTDAAAYLKDEDFLSFVEDAERFSGYRPGGYHPVHLGERYGDGGRYKILHKLGNGTYSTVWLAEDLAATKYVESGNTNH